MFVKTITNTLICVHTFCGNFVTYWFEEIGFSRKNKSTLTYNIKQVISFLGTLKLL